MINTITVSEFLDAPKVGAFHLRVLTLCAVVSALGGFDMQALGYVAPTLIKHWNLHAVELGPVFSVGLGGLMLGALLIAPLADRVGRRPVLLWSLTLFGASTLITATAGNITTLAILQFITGLGLGGTLPNAVALTSEYMPRRRRAFLVVMMFNGFNLGSMLGGILSAQFVTTLGWQAVFVVGGLLALLSVPVVRLLLPESVAFLAQIGAPRTRIIQLLQRIQPDLHIDEHTRILATHGQPGNRVGIRMLLSQGRALPTVLLWVVTFMSLLDIYILVSWLPTALNVGGAPVGAAIIAGIMLQLGSVVGSVPLGLALDRFGASAAMTPAYLLAALCIAGIGAFTSNLPLTFAIAFGAGFGLIGGQAGANALAATSYPTEVRSTGVGWALGIGSVGSIVGPVIGGGLMAVQISIRNLFLLSAIPALIAAIAVLMLGFVIARRSANNKRTMLIQP